MSDLVEVISLDEEVIATELEYETVLININEQVAIYIEEN